MNMMFTTSGEAVRHDTISIVMEVTKVRETMVRSSDIVTSRVVIRIAIVVVIVGTNLICWMMTLIRMELQVSVVGEFAVPVLMAIMWMQVLSEVSIAPVGYSMRMLHASRVVASR